MHNKVKKISKWVLIALITFTAFFNFNISSVSAAEETQIQDTEKTTEVNEVKDQNKQEIKTELKDGLITVQEEPTTDQTVEDQTVPQPVDKTGIETRAGPTPKAGSVITGGALTGYTHSGTAVSPDGLISAWFSSQTIELLYADGQLGFCVEPWQSVDNIAGTSGYVPSEEGKALADQYILHGYYLQSKSLLNYAVVTMMIWEDLYNYHPATNIPNYAAEKQKVLNSIAQATTRPSFDGQTIKVRVGTPLTITDTKGVLASYDIGANPTGVEVTKNGNQITLTATADDVNGILRLGRYMNTGMPENSLLFTHPSSQDVYVGGHTDPVFSNLNIEVEKFGSIELAKQDNLGNYVPGTKFDLFYNSGNNAGTLIGNYTTGADGKIRIDEILPEEVKVVETYVPAPLILDATPAYKTIIPNQVVSYTKTNQRATGTAILKKQDSETGTTPQGDAILSNAVYGLYATENINDDITGALIYPKDQEVLSETVGTDLTVTKTGLYPGKYYWKEKTPSTGYNLDPTKFDIDLSYVNSSTSIISKPVTSNEDVIKGKDALMKVSSDGTVGLLPPVAGAEFTYKLQSEVNLVGWDVAKTYFVGETDAFGYLETDYMPYGVYTRRETKTPTNYITAPDRVVVIHENIDNPRPETINDAPFLAKVKMVKQDLTTGQTVTFDYATFKLVDTATGEFVKQYVGNKYIDEFTTTEDGTIYTAATGEAYTPLVLHAGKYEVVEVHTPAGFLDLAEPVYVEVNDTAAYEVNDNNEKIITVIIQNERPTASLTIAKTFEQNTYMPDSDKTAGFEVRYTGLLPAISPVDGSVLYEPLQVIANPDSEDGLWYVKDGEEITIDGLFLPADGKLPVAVTEKLTSEGWKLDETIHNILFTKNDNTTKIYSQGMDVKNEVIKTDLEVIKTDAYTGDVVVGVEGIEFTMYADEALTKELVKIPVDSISGKAILTDLPYGFEGYLKETAVPENWYMSDEVVHVVINKDTEGVGETYSIDFANKQKESLHTTATGINGEKVLDPTIENTLIDVTAVANADSEKTYTIITRLHDAEENIIMERVYEDVTFEEADAKFTSELTIEANKLKEGKYYFSETMYEKGHDDPEEDTPVAEHNDPNDDGQTIRMEKTEYTILANKIDSLTKENIKSEDFVFEFTGYTADGEGETFKIHGDKETGIATFKFEGTGTYTKVTIKEIDAPKGYLLSKEIKTVEMKDFDKNHVYEFEYMNTALPDDIKAGDTTNMNGNMGLLGLSGLIMLLIGAVIFKRNEEMNFETGVTTIYTGESFLREVATKELHGHDVHVDKYGNHIKSTDDKPRAYRRK